MPSESGDPRPESAVATTTLLDLIRQNPRHSRAWPDLMDRYRPYLWTALRSSGVSPEAAEDLIQEVFLSVFAALARGGGFDPSRGNFKSYLATIIARTVRRYLQKAAAGPAAAGGTDA